MMEKLALLIVLLASLVATQQDIYARVGEEDQTGYYLFTCNFENGLCGFQLTATSFYSAWQRVQSRVVGNTLDHTFGNDSGHYLRAVLPPGTSLVAAARSKEFPPMRRRFCVSFWYFVSGMYSELSLYISNSTASPSNIFSSQESNGWSYSEIPVQATSQPFTVVLQFRNRYSYNSGASAIVDDFVVSDINCNGK